MKKYLLALGAGALLAAPATAEVSGGNLTGGSAQANGGTFNLFVPGSGFTVGNDQQQNNDLHAFDENQNALLTSDITADFGGLLTAGQRYASHFVFFDPGPSRSAIGDVSFGRDILAVFTSTSTLDATDADFGLTGVTYQTPGLRGLEGPDSFSVSGNTLSIDWNASNPGDYVRVLTAVPEPATWAMMIFGFGMAGGAMRRRRTTAKMSFA